MDNKCSRYFKMYGMHVGVMGLNCDVFYTKLWGCRKIITYLISARNSAFTECFVLFLKVVGSGEWGRRFDGPGS